MEDSKNSITDWRINKELGISGDCAISPSNLIGYWRLNTGAGSSIADRGTGEPAPCSPMYG